MVESASRRRFVRLLLMATALLPLTTHAQEPASPPAEAPDPSPPEPTDGLDPGDPDFARKVMERFDDLYRGDSSHGTMKMVVKTKHYTRTMEMETWSRGKDLSLVRILSPKKERGTATLKTDGDLFTYLNKTGRTIKITGGMLGASWMGSHFTNDDLVRDTRYGDDFDIQLSYKGIVADVPLFLFTLTPKPNAPVVWGKVEVAVRQSDYQPLAQVFYDEDMHAVRELRFSGHKTMAGRTLPTKMVMRPRDGSGEYTQIEYGAIDFSVDLPKSFFSLQKLQSM